MESNIIIAVIIGLIVGVVIALFLKPKSKKDGDVTISDIDASNQNILKTNIEALEKEKATLHKRLLESEKFLETIRESNNGTPSEVSDKLLKEIKNLKDEIEDLEDNLDEQKKSNKKIREEKSTIEDELENIEKEKKDLSEEKENLETKLQTVATESKESKESLDFINDILNAQNSSNKDFEKLDEDTWGIYFFIKEKISHNFEQPENIDNYAWEWRNSELKTWIKGKKVVAIVGEFSAGKTSIVNRILSQDDPSAPLLPVSSKETTAIPTYVSKSKDFNCQFYSPDSELRNIKKETFEKVTKSVLDKVNVSHLIKYFVLSYDNQYLDKISILDTPGFASNSDDIIKRTTDVVKEADAIFWVIDANMGDINQTSLDVMKSHLNEMPLYFIINKSDTKSPGELDKLEERIKETAKKNEIKCEAVIRFSQKENVDVLMKHIQEIEIKEQEPLMRHISNVLDEIIKDLKEEKGELKKVRKENLNELSQTESNFENIQSEISYSAEKIKRFVKPKETWLGLGENKYQIEREDYNDFQNNIESIVGLSGAIKEQVEFYSKKISSKKDIDDKTSDNKYQLKYIEQIKKDFIKLIKDYNPNLLN